MKRSDSLARQVGSPTPTPRNVGLRLLEPKQNFLLEVIPTSTHPIGEWVREHKDFVQQAILTHGAVLLRGFDASIEGFQDVVKMISQEGNPLAYKGGTSPRSQVKEGVYLSTTFPPSGAIIQHQEMAYMRTFPTKISLFCQEPAEHSGETPLCNMRHFMKLVDPGLIKRMKDRQIMYIRNFTPGFGPDWPQAFETGSKEEVERICREKGITYEWRDGNRLRTRSTAQGVANHHLTGEPLYFNQSHSLSVYTTSPGITTPGLRALQPLMPPEVREWSWTKSFDELTYCTAWGDSGKPIETSVLSEVGDIFNEEKVSFAWKRGDILLVDNMLTSHGRNPFIGEKRRILVMLTDLYSPEAL